MSGVVRVHPAPTEAEIRVVELRTGQELSLRVQLEDGTTLIFDEPAVRQLHQVSSRLIGERVRIESALEDEAHFYNDWVKESW